MNNTQLLIIVWSNFYLKNFLVNSISTSKNYFILNSYLKNNQFPHNFIIFYHEKKQKSR